MSKPVMHVYMSRPGPFGGKVHTTLCGRMVDPSRSGDTGPTVNCKLCLKKKVGWKARERGNRNEPVSTAGNL